MSEADLADIKARLRDLEEDHSELKAEIKNSAARTDKKVDGISEKVDGLIGFQRFVMGVIATAGAIVGFLADPIKKRLGLG